MGTCLHVVVGVAGGGRQGLSGCTDVGRCGQVSACVGMCGHVPLSSVGRAGMCVVGISGCNGAQVRAQADMREHVSGLGKCWHMQVYPGVCCKCREGMAGVAGGASVAGLRNCGQVCASVLKCWRVLALAAGCGARWAGVARTNRVQGCV